ncbi:ATP-binding cassette domain-containing protein [Streptococcus dysgalactiae]|uniref:ATP-binding cassette domain-containing protein n=1 Tax=Streptococcus dysgalactiae TaxID=1334 RepID=UPI001F0DEA8A|nr:ABC transporter ATP-binding protein [Streptococcus dysgalactiae]
MVSKLDKEIKNMCNSEISSYKIIGVATFFAAFGNVLGQIGSLIISGLFVARKLLTFGDILSVSTISVSVFNGVSNLSSKIIQIKGVFPIFEKQLTFSNLVKEELLEENQKISNITFTSQLELMNVNLTFNGYNIFSDTNYRFKKGGRYCIIGPSGTGKSTLFKLLNGSLNYDSGEIELDGQSITKIKGKALRSQITYVEQTPYIFNTTLRENIVLDGQFSDKEINDAIDIVGLSEEVNRLGEGIDTWIGDGQLTLSGGQKQRVALARAILNGSHFLLLDESTSSLNIQLAQTIEKKLLTRSDYSIIFITHHLSEEMKVFFDDILELRDGKLISQK